MLVDSHDDQRRLGSGFHVFAKVVMISPDKNTACPCGRMQSKRSLTFEQCCQRYLDHFDSVPAPDAESLMRSRYSAFVLQRSSYLLKTWFPSHRPVELEFDDKVKWLGLQVKAHRVLDSEHAEVGFVARFRAQGKASRLHELSRFTFQDDRWYYVDGAMLD
jgi:SEC-C motif-containing protein